MINISNYIFVWKNPHQPLLIEEYNTILVEQNKRFFKEEAVRAKTILVLNEVNWAVLRAIRYWTEMSQEEFGYLMEIDSRTVKRIEARKAWPRSSSVVNIISIALQLKYNLAIMRKI